MLFAQSWRRIEAEAAAVVAVLVSALPLGLLHWLALRCSEG
jgi:hypothetical protein